VAPSRNTDSRLAEYLHLILSNLVEKYEFKMQETKCQCYKTFFVATGFAENKLERFSFESLLSHVYHFVSKPRAYLSGAPWAGHCPYP
jgi:hypothetical protein